MHMLHRTKAHSARTHQSTQCSTVPPELGWQVTISKFHIPGQTKSYCCQFVTLLLPMLTLLAIGGINHWLQHMVSCASAPTPFGKLCQLLGITKGFVCFSCKHVATRQQLASQSTPLYVKTIHLTGLPLLAM